MEGDSNYGDPRFDYYKSLLPNEKCDVGYIWLVLEVILLFVTVVGNLLVIVSIVAVKVLRHAKNYLILSLAVADLLVGLVVLPFKMSVQQNCEKWKAGDFLCHVWITVDIMCSTASIFGLSVISIDRYIAIARPLFYKVNSTPCKIYTAIAVIWLISFLVTIPKLTSSGFYLQLVSKNEVFPVCVNAHGPWELVFGVVFIFFLPLGIMTFVYGTIWRILAKQKPKASSYKGTHAECRRLPNGAPSPTLCIICRFVEEKKGCIMLGIVMGVFVFCWLPFFSVMFAESILEIFGRELQLPIFVYDALVWMGYVNSCANPFIYTMFNGDFRFAFKEIICLRGTSLNDRIRNRTYNRQVGSSGTDQSTMSVKSTMASRQTDLVKYSSTPQIAVEVDS